MKKKSFIAFTLAEVLITLGIVGIVAVLTVPTLVKNYQRIVLESQFRKAVAVLNEAVKLWQLNEDNIWETYYDNTDKKGQALRTSFVKYLKGDIVEAPRELKPYYTSTKNSTQQMHYCPASCCAHPLASNRMIETYDGIMYGVCARDNQLNFYFDINGYDKGPNKWGIDLFDLDYNKDNKLYNYYSCSSSGCANYFSHKYNGTNVNDGIGCTTCALQRSDYFRKIDW